MDQTVLALLITAVAALVAGRFAPARPAYRGGLVGVAMILAMALTEPFRPAATSVASDLAATILFDVVVLGVGIGAGWLGGRLRG